MPNAHRRRQPAPGPFVSQLWAVDAVLTTAQVASALGVSVNTVRRSDLPACYIGKRTKRYVWGRVLEALATRVEVVTAPRKRRRNAA